MYQSQYLELLSCFLRFSKALFKGDKVEQEMFQWPLKNWSVMAALGIEKT